jgi:sugar (pentulose or hexulose) kinase
MIGQSTALAIGIDVGTSGVRAAALSGEGDVLAFAQYLFADPAHRRVPARWWAGVSHCLDGLSDQISLSGVLGLAVDGTSGTVLAVDAAGAPVGEVLMYNDPCPAKDIVAAIDAAAPHDSPARGANSGLARAAYLSRQPGVASLMHQADWLLLQLGLARPSSDENNALKTGYDPNTESWPSWIAAAGMDIGLLPEVRRAGVPLAPIGLVGKRWNLSPDCRLHAGTTDGCASFLATGAQAIGDAVTALGSTLVLKLVSGTPVNAPQFGVYSHRVGDLWLVGGASNTGGAVIKALIGDDRIEQLTERMDAHTPTQLNYYPLLVPGERFPINDPVFQPRLAPRPADDAIFFQAILEGITEVERLGYERLAALGAPSLRSIRTVGGGAKNPVWTAMRQREMAVEFLAPHSREAAVGTAFLVLSNMAKVAS